MKICSLIRSFSTLCTSRAHIIEELYGSLSPDNTRFTANTLKDDEKVALIRMFWNDAPYSVWYTTRANNRPLFNDVEAHEMIKTGYIDYLCGKSMHICTNTKIWDMTQHYRNIFGDLQDASIRAYCLPKTSKYA